MTGVQTCALPISSKYQEISRDFLVKPLKVEAKIPFRVPPFELHKTKIRFGSEDFLEELLGTMVNNPNVKFEILCYPDNDNDPISNKRMTEERCKALTAYFTTNGVNMERITIMGSDKTDPNNPPPATKRAKGKRYIGSSYIVIKSIK